MLSFEFWEIFKKRVFTEHLRTTASAESWFTLLCSEMSSSFSRSSCPEVFCKKGIFRNFAKFTRKHLCQSLSSNRVAGWGLQLYKKETLTQMFFCEFCEIFKTTFFYKIPQLAVSDFLAASNFRNFVSEKRRI